MEKTKKSTRKPSNKSAHDSIKNSYIEYLLTEGKRPASVFKYCLDLEIKEDDFYNHFGSFEGLEKYIWKGFIDKTIARLNADEAFGAFSVREKILAFYYTLLEELKSNRSFVVFQLTHSQKPEFVPEYIKSFKATFESFFESLVNEGKATGEIANRPLLDKRYPTLFWLHMGFLLLFWKEDESPGFEKTDAAVEKSVNLAFDLIGKGAVDSFIDFAKFLYQTKTK